MKIKPRIEYDTKKKSTEILYIIYIKLADKDSMN